MHTLLTFLACAGLVALIHLPFFIIAFLLR